MRELERDRDRNPRAPTALTIVGPGRVGRAIAAAARAAGIEATLIGREQAAAGGAGGRGGPALRPRLGDRGGLRRLSPQTSAPLASSATPAARRVSTRFQPRPRRGASVFSIHPLQTIRGERPDLAGAFCAVSGFRPAGARPTRKALARSLGMSPFEVPEEKRAAYHAAAAIASNFLVALEESAAELLEGAGVADARELLAPIVLRTAANWAEHGRAALTGPIARGDEATVSPPSGGARGDRPRAARPLPGDGGADRRPGRAPQRGDGGMKVVRDRAEPEARARPSCASAARPPAWCRRWAPSTRATSRCCAAPVRSARSWS